MLIYIVINTTNHIAFQTLLLKDTLLRLINLKYI